MTTTRPSLIRVLITARLLLARAETLHHQCAEKQHQVEDRYREKRAGPTCARAGPKTVAAPSKENRAEQPCPYEVAMLFDTEGHEQQAHRDEREEIADDAVLGGADAEG